MTFSATVSNPVLTIHVSNMECVTLMQCRGMLTLDSSAFLKAEVKCRIPENGRLILDLGGIRRVDSSGLGAIVGLYLSAKSKNCELELVNLNQQIRKLLSISNLLSIFESSGPPEISKP